MCGIVGFYKHDGLREENSARLVRSMADSLIHRGPDASGEWIDSVAGIAIAHRRLSVLDLSETGSQPMLSRSARYVIAFNGEIYNHLDLRQDLRDVRWRGHSDTETILASIEEWGFEGSLVRFHGMFALVVWDRAERRLFLARDRLGEKPLYYGWQGNTFFFASELKALFRHPDFLAEIDRDVIPAYLKSGYVRAPWSIYSGIHKLRPGSYVTIDRDASKYDTVPVVPYWSIERIVDDARRATPAPEEEQLADLKSSLMTAVSRQIVADVPVGAFLSGGIDSSTVVSLMQQLSNRQVETFTIGFQEDDYNEAHYAKAIANHLGTKHHELYVTDRHARSVIQDLPKIYDEPFADPSAIPSYLMSRLARKHVTVCLSGDGGDELLCGYARYPQAASYWQYISKVPRLFRRPIATAFRSMGTRKGVLIGKMLNAENCTDLYRALISQWQCEGRLVNIDNSGHGIAELSEHMNQAESDLESMMYLDSVSYLPDMVLVKMDRAAMATSLETRMPILDHKVVELCWKMPIQRKYRDGIGKWPLRQILSRYVPDNLVNRPKSGFNVPIDRWLRSSLRDWADDLLSPSAISRQGFLKSASIADAWKRHRDGKTNFRDPLWGVLMFQAWLDQHTELVRLRPATHSH